MTAPVDMLLLYRYERSMLLLLAACDAGFRSEKLPDGSTAETEPTTDSTDSGDSADTADSGDSGDSGDSADTSIPDDTQDTQSCAPITCADVGATCGSLDDGCGGTLICGECGAWSSCQANACVEASCVPYEVESTDGGGRCEDLNEAWTGRGINVGYYPFKVLTDTYQYSGDYDGPDGVTFTAGSTYKGVILQVIPAGSYVGLSSVGPYYDPAGECLPSGECGDGDVDACTESTPPLRPGIAGYYWGYAYSGASHMQGWIYADPTHLEYAGLDSSHPCANGPASVDFEVSEACGAPTTCDGETRTCGDANKCDEGIDDCGSTTCGAESGGALTPSAHRSTVTYPTEGVHACTTKTPPDPSIQCLANGGDDDFFYVYPHGAYLYWAQNSTTKYWLHYGDEIQSYFHTRDAEGVLWEFVEVLHSGAPVLTPESDGTGDDSGCSADTPEDCEPCKNGGTCGWVQEVFLQ